MLECLDAAAVRQWCAVGLDALRVHRAEIDELNVYPVPDGDTGTNLVLTLTSAWEALQADRGAEPSVNHLRPPDRPSPVLNRLARGALLGARGNSGVIVSQLLRATAESLAEVAEVRGRALALALDAAAQAAYAAVADPAEGTVLSVATAAARAARDADTDDLATVARAAAAGAGEALARTPEQLPVLARAGVVDAGGRGLVVLLDALVEVVTGQAPPAAPPTRVLRDRSLLTVARETGSTEYAFEVQYLLDASSDAVTALRAELAGLGDSLVIVGSGAPLEGADATPGWNIHVHVNDVGAAIEAGIRAGRPHRLSVTRFADEPVTGSATGLDLAMRGLVVVAPGPGLAEIFAGEGAAVVGGAGEGARPSTRDVLAAIRATGAGRVIVLPNDPNVLRVAQAAAEEARAAGIRVGVVPTRSPVQAMAAMAVRDDERHFHDEIIAMAEAAGACRYAEVTVATKEAVTGAGRCVAGDVLGLVEGEVTVIGKELAPTCVTVLDRLLGGGGELVTLVLGAAAPDELGDQVAEHLRQAWPAIEVQTYHGGQPHHHLLIGVE